MTTERMNEIIKVIGEGSEMERILIDGPDVASESLISRGYDFTADEISEVICKIDELSKIKEGDGELNEGALEDVAGGGVAGVIIAGAAIGTYLYIKKKGLYVPDPYNKGKVIKLGGK